MSGLSNALRERVSRKGRTAQVHCGALGILTVEALSFRDCAILSRKDPRALFYAACRELQQAGEELRRERKIFTPDEIMHFVSNQEAEAAAQTVLRLSGVKIAEPKDAEKTDDPKDTNALKDPDGSLELEGKEPENRLDFVQDSRKEFREIRRDVVQMPLLKERMIFQKNGTPDEIGRASHEFPAMPEAELQTQNLWNFSQKHLQDVAVDLRNPAGICPAEGTEKDEIRESEHENKSEVPEVLHEMESDFEEAAGDMTHESKSEVPEVLHEMESDFGEAAGDMTHESKSEVPEVLHETESDFEEAAGDMTHESKSEVPGVLHETESDFEEAAGDMTHESKSEVPEVLHEMESDFGEAAGDMTHESKSEVPEVLHEMESDFGEAAEDIAHESKSEVPKVLHETESDSVELSGAETDAEYLARSLLEGLRRAAAAR